MISATPGAVLGGICVVLYGMIGLLGAKIWKENHVDFGNPINLIPAAAGIIIGIGDVKLPITEGFTLGGIALGTIVTVAVYHIAHAIAPRELREAADGASLIYENLFRRRVRCHNHRQCLSNASYLLSEVVSCFPTFQAHLI